MASLYETPVTALRGVGEKRAGLFRKLGAPTVGDLLRCYPRAWEDLSCPGTIRTAPPDQPFAIRATVTRAPSAVRVHGGSTLYRAFADDGETVFPITFFNNPYVVNLLREGEEYIFYGRVHFSFKSESCCPRNSIRLPPARRFVPSTARRRASIPARLDRPSSRRFFCFLRRSATRSPTICAPRAVFVPSHRRCTTFIFLPPHRLWRRRAPV